MTMTPAGLDRASDVPTRLLAALASMDQEAIVACFDPAVRAHFHPSQLPQTGHHPIRLAFQTFASAFDSITVRETGRVQIGSMVAIAWRAEGAPTLDAPDEVAGLLVLKLSASGKVCEFWNHFVRA